MMQNAERAAIARHDPHSHQSLVALLASDALQLAPLHDALLALSRSLCSATGVDRVAMTLRDTSRDDLIVVDSDAAAPVPGATRLNELDQLALFKFAEPGRPFLAEDVYDHATLAPFAEQIFRPLDVRSMMQIAVDLGGRMVGTLNLLVRAERRSWTEATVQTALAFTRLATLLVDRHERNRHAGVETAADLRLQRQQRTLSRLMIETTQNTLDLGQALRLLSAAAAATLETERVSFWRFAPDNSAIHALDIFDVRDGRHVADVSLLRKDHAAYFDAVLEDGLVIVNDIKSDPRTQTFLSDYVPVTGVTALLDMAIVANKATVGVVCVESCRSNTHWTEEQKLFVASITSLVALAIERHERLRAEAVARDASRRLSSHFTAVNGVMQSEDFLHGTLEVALRHLTRTLCHEIRADRVALDVAVAGAPRFAEVYCATHDAHRPLTNSVIVDHCGSLHEPVVESDRVTDTAAGSQLRVPVRFQGRVVGSVQAWTGLRNSSWSAGEMLMASITAHLSTLVLERQHRQNIEANLRHANRAAEDANRAKTQFLANMSHEIRTPMNGVFGMTDLLMHTTLTARQTEIVATIQQSSSALLTIINDILDISRIESGRMEIEQRPFCVRDCIDGAVALFVDEARRKSIRLDVTVAPDCPVWAIGDAARLRQICVNVLGNAIKFTAKGAVAVSISNAVASPTTPRLTFRISDTGIGIDPAMQQRLFQPFAQADGTITRRFGGTGLGLSISRSLIEMMGGSIRIDSVAGQGTVVTFDVAAKAAQPPAALPSDSAASLSAWLSNVSTPDAEAEAKSRRRFSGRILVAEDNLVNQEVTRELVGGLGCSVTCVENGEEAQRAFEGGKYDLVLMDCQMPVKDGLSATRAIRAFEQHTGRPRTPIVAVTANAFAEDRNACLDAGMDGYLSKPFNTAQLDGILQRWLPTHLVVERRGSAPRVSSGQDGDLPDLDPVVLEPMKRLRVDFYQRLLRTFLQHTPRLVDALVQAAHAGDLAALKAAAHSLKSSSANVGASRLSALARDIEGAVTRGEPRDFAGLGQDVDAAFARVKQMFDAELAKAAPPAAAPLAKPA